MMKKMFPNSKLSADGPLFDDEKMFEFVFRAYFPRLMAFVRKFITDRNMAEDIIQDAFLKIWLRRKEIEESTFQSYLFTLVRNSCLDYIKHQKIVNNHSVYAESSVLQELPYYADFFSDPYHQTLFKEIQGEIDTVIRNLPEQTRKIFCLSRFEGLKNSEIAKMLKVSVRTIEKHNKKALQKLKAHLSSRYLLAITVLDLMKELNS
jgi:RNA polymerase sigma-70 factor (ECF subfamily)